MNAVTVSAASRYAQLVPARSSVLNRARKCALLTIPSLMPPEGHNETSTLATPFQGVGARGLNNLASKFLLSLFPQAPFFRLAIDDFMLEKLVGRDGLRAEVEKGLNKVERAVMGKVDAEAIRVSAFEALKQLINSGNVLVYLPPSGGMRVFKLDRYVVRRDPMGNVLEIVVQETVDPNTLPPELLGRIRADGNTSVDKTLDLYTHITRKSDKWEIRQEVGGQTVPKSQGTYPLDKSPWIPLRFTKIDGEDYGRSYIEEYLGDLQSLEALTKAIVQGSAIAAKVIFLVNPNGTTSVKALTDSESGDVKSGNASDVTTVQLDKFADFRVAQETMAAITQRLSFAFLLNTAVQRGGDRVTAEEIRYMAGELEDALGGVYSILSQEFQLPLITRLMFDMERTKKLPTLPKGVVKPTITTGLEALGRGHDMNKLRMFGTLAAEAQNLPPEINRGDYLTRTGTALGIDMAGLVKSPEQLQQEQQAAQMQALIEKLGPNAMKLLQEQGQPNGEIPTDRQT